MNPRIIDIDTFTAMAPLLRRIGADLARAYRDMRRVMAMGAHDLRVDLFGEALDRVRSCVSEFEGLGGAVRSCGPVCVDFLAEVDAAIGYLSWGNASRASARFVSTESLCIAEFAAS